MRIGIPPSTGQWSKQQAQGPSAPYDPNKDPNEG